MENITKKLTINDLKVGMPVDSDQLSDIFNYYVILTNSSVSNDGTKIIGTIAWFGKEMTKETEKYEGMKNIAIINYTDENTEVYDD